MTIKFLTIVNAPAIVRNNMKQRLTITILAFGLLSCTYNAKEYNYIKIFSICKADTITDLNKGLGLYNFLHYNPDSDSAVFRFVQSVDPNIFNTYSGQFGNKAYADTLALLIALLKHHKNGILPYSIDGSTAYCGPQLYVEYSDSKGKHYHTFTICDNDTLSIVSAFFHRLERLLWKKVKINNNSIDETNIVVKVLKETGTYDGIVKPYVALPCKTGIETDKLKGIWRTIGDKYNDATFNYWINKIDSTGKWTTERVVNGEVTRKYISKIKAVKNNEIIIENENGLTTLEILNLTRNCFEYRNKQRKEVWRLDRME